MLHKRKSIKQIIESFSQKESSPPEAHGISKTILEENNEEAKKAKRICKDVFSATTR
jgi:hypothetical protein